MMTIRRALAILSGAALLAGAASAQTTLYNNLTASIGSYDPIAGPGSENSGPLYNSFSTGSTALVLTDVKLYLERMGVVQNTFQVILYANSGNTPGAQIQVLGTLNDSAISGSGGAYDVPVSPAVQLAASTRYFIGLIPTSTGNINTETTTYWATTSSTGGTGNIQNEYYCLSSFFEVPSAMANARSLKPRGEPIGTECFSNSQTEDPFLMSVTANTATVPTAAAPALSFPAMSGLALLLAAAAAVALRRTEAARG